MSSFLALDVRHQPTDEQHLPKIISARLFNAQGREIADPFFGVAPLDPARQAGQHDYNDLTALPASHASVQELVVDLAAYLQQCDVDVVRAVAIARVVHLFQEQLYDLLPLDVYKRLRQPSTFICMDRMAMKIAGENGIGLHNLLQRHGHDAELDALAAQYRGQGGLLHPAQETALAGMGYRAFCLSTMH